MNWEMTTDTNFGVRPISCLWNIDDPWECNLKSSAQKDQCACHLWGAALPKLIRSSSSEHIGQSSFPVVPTCGRGGACVASNTFSVLPSPPARRWPWATLSGVKGFQHIWWRYLSGSGAPWPCWLSSGSSSGTSWLVVFVAWIRKNYMGQLRVAACAALSCEMKFEAWKKQVGLLVIIPLLPGSGNKGLEDEFRADPDSKYCHGWTCTWGWSEGICGR